MLACACNSSTLGRLKWEDHKFEINPGNLVRPCPKKGGYWGLGMLLTVKALRSIPGRKEGRKRGRREGIVLCISRSGSGGRVNSQTIQSSLEPGLTVPTQMALVLCDLVLGRHGVLAGVGMSE